MTGVATKAGNEFTITLDGVEYPVTVEGGSKPPWKLVVNGRSFTVKPEDHGTVVVDGIAYEVALDGGTVTAGEASHNLEVAGLSLGQTSPGPSVGSTPAATRGGAGAIVAIMPGQVTRVLVEEGQEVEAGEGVCVLEAMKMENELTADRGGVVKALHVRPGDDVEKDQVLIEIE